MKFSSNYGLRLEECPKIVVVGIVDAQFRLLCGKRRDNKLWTCPGGHVDKGEDLELAAKREVLEETGIKLDNLTLIDSKKFVSHRTGKEFVVFAYKAKVFSASATNKNDPDREVSEWKWVPILKNSEELLPENRHAKEDLILKYLGLV